MATHGAQRLERVCPGESSARLGEVVVRLHSDAPGSARLMAELTTHANLNAGLVEDGGHWYVELRPTSLDEALPLILETVSRFRASGELAFVRVELSNLRESRRADERMATEAELSDVA
jgi:hypothetical protein